MNEPVLVIMAAGMGSRYGGLKQIDPVDPDGNVLMDFSIYDAVKAGFREVIFVIRRENEQIFRDTAGSRIPSCVRVRYVCQDIENIPAGFQVPQGRVKPWGTGHAVLSCMGASEGPFAVINSDDYYGPSAFRMIYDYLTTHEDDDIYRYMMVGFRLGNTLTENGHVSRGVCSVDAGGRLLSIRERVYIVEKGDGAAYSEDDGKTFTDISPEETVSMNLWGFTPSFLPELKKRFADFMRDELPSDPLRAEYFLPSVVGQLIEEGKAGVTVLRSPDRWYGMTYKEDRTAVAAAIASLKSSGVYPEHLWESGI